MKKRLSTGKNKKYGSNSKKEKQVDISSSAKDLEFMKNTESHSIFITLF